MESFAKIKPLTKLVTCSILDPWQGSEYASKVYTTTKLSKFYSFKIYSQKVITAKKLFINAVIFL